MSMNIFDKLILNVFANSGQTFASTERHDPYKNHNFAVTITGKKTFVKSGFQKISGLKIKTDVIEYRDGDDVSLTPHKSAGLVKSDPITFERGMSEDGDMFNWMAQQAQGASNDDGHKVTIKIELKERGRGVVKTWELRECWISDYETGDFDAMGNAAMVEKMVVQHEGLKVLNTKSAGTVSGDRKSVV